MTGHTPLATRHTPYRGFTLIELLVAIGILALLTGLTVKGVRKFREAAQSTDTTNSLMTIQAGIQAYYSTFHAYPGPIPNRTVGANAPNPTYQITFPDIDSSNTNFDFTGSGTLVGLTGTENLVLGLFGGLKYDTTIPGVVYSPQLVGQGPSSLSTLQPGKHQAFLENQNLLSWRSVNNKKTGKFQDDAGQATDTIIPELVDRYPAPLPILYLRADTGAAWNANLVGAPTNAINNVITDDADDNPATHVAQYHFKHIKAYTTSSIGESKHAVNGSYAHGLKSVDITKQMDTEPEPHSAYPYLLNPTSTVANTTTAHANDVPRKKDEYILISAGPDRIYGTKDDITNFGSVVGD